jgi:hypothetical protein
LAATEVRGISGCGTDLRMKEGAQVSTGESEEVCDADLDAECLY